MPLKVEINVPDGISNEWRVETHTVTEEDARFSQMRAVMHGSSRYTPAGTYKGLKRNGTLVMSNTSDEIRDCVQFVNNATGNVLVNGLGLGVLLQMLLNKTDITQVTVIEKSKDVIKLVAPTYEKDKRVKIIHDDAFEYTPPKGEKYDAVWHDIWNDITSDNLEEMSKLHRKYSKRTKYQKSWCRSLCERMKRQEKREFMY